MPVSADFGRVAGVYDLLAGLVFGSALRRAQRAALAAGLPARALNSAPRVLVLGGGTGWLLADIWRQCPGARVLYLEASDGMLARTRARLRRHPVPPGAALELRQGTEADLADLHPDERFDVLITFFVLDCFSAAELPAALARLDAARQPGAPWLVADFRPARRGWRRALLAAMYWFFRLMSGLRVRRLPPWPAALAALGLRPAWRRHYYGGAVAALVLREAGARTTTAQTATAGNTGALPVTGAGMRPAG